jgi:prepilin-type N-terminal cleavage/methylation domain-containing protein
MNMHKKLKGGFTLVELLVVIVIIAALAGLTAPMVMRQRKKADQTEAINNARQVGLALMEFDNEYGRFPDNSTGQSVIDRTGTALTFGGGTANDHFRQLLAADIANSEQIFYAKTAFSRKPDNIFGTQDRALERGEVGFGYLMNGTNAFSTSGNPGRPIIVAPLAYDGSAVSTNRFDPDFYDSKAVILKLDNSATSINIRKEDGTARMDGNELLATGANTVWGAGGITPTIVVPQPR